MISRSIARPITRRPVRPVSSSYNAGPTEEQQPYIKYPLDPEAYGPARFFPNSAVITSTNVALDSELDRYTIGASTGNFILSGNPTVSVVPDETIVIWFQSVSGTPTTATVRFITAAGAVVGSTTALALEDGYYRETRVVPPTAAFVQFFCTNTSGTPVVISRPAIAVAGAGTLDAAVHGTQWLTTSAGKVSGAGTAATLNVDGTVTMPTPAIQFGRSDINFSAGDSHVWQVKLDDLEAGYVLVRYQGVDGTGLVYLENWGGGWWGGVVAVPSGVGAGIYARIEVNNNASSLYTAATRTLEQAHLHIGTSYPKFIPTGEAAVGAYAKTEIVVQQHDDQINVFMPGSNLATNKYIRWQLRSYTGAAGSGAGWTIERLHECRRTGDDSFMVGNDLTDVGEHLLAVRLAGDEFMGGDTHGYQIGSSVVLNINGAPQAIDGATSYRCTSAELITVSELNDGTPRFAVDTSVLFDSDGVTVGHSLEALENVDIVACYSMLSFHRYLNGTASGTSKGTIFSTVAWSPDYTPTSTAVAGDVITDADRYLLTGDKGLSVEAEAITGWTPATSESYLQRASNSLKLYFSPLPVDNLLISFSVDNMWICCALHVDKSRLFHVEHLLTDHRLIPTRHIALPPIRNHRLPILPCSARVGLYSPQAFVRPNS